jgi:thiamine-phosphate pyrophosphorylase
VSTPPPRARFPGGLYAVLDDSVRPELPMREKARLVLEGGARVLQLRMKRTPPREALAAIRAILELTRRVAALCLVNDRVDYALATSADGVHVGDDDLPTEDARRLLGPSRLVGRTARGLEDILEASRMGADYVGLGPIFPTTTKTVDHPPLGIEALRAIAAESPLPIVAISGIGLKNIADVAAAGAHAAAVVSDLLNAIDLTEQARRLVHAFDSGAVRRSIGRDSP